MIKYRVAGTSSDQVVLTPSGSGWENVCVCDPAVSRGSFLYNSTNYQFIMYYYTASPNCTSDNKIGIAFSNNGTSWVKYANNPIVKSAGNNCPNPATLCLSSYGAGMAQVRNGNGQAGVQLWYIDTNGAQGSGIYERLSNNGISFGPAQRLSINGINCAPACLGGPGVALSPGSPPELYLFIGINVMRLYKIPYDLRFTGTWTFLDDFTAAEAGASAIVEGGFRTDIYGNLSGTTWPTIVTGFGSGPCYPQGPNCDARLWSLRQANGN